MKKLAIACMMSFGMLLSAQNYNLPAASPKQTVMQQLSISNITVEYGRPAVKGRSIFGGLVPFDKVWRAGANGTTKVSFGQDFVFGGKIVKKGTYGLFIIPKSNEWEIILNSDADGWGAYAYDEKKNVASTMVPVMKSMEMQEWFKIDFENLSEEKVMMTFNWDKTKVAVPIMVANPAEISKIIDKLKEIKKVNDDMSKMK
ncbi:DUF2911 domain-containing protein [Frigoriflavimonas asaccharolytica]|uniref:DUF2911 family protein n=1 Tax=Frigoriflavimonas asaccharolytica TaxID=2735899 RepID=A0A8J8G6K9_9FLAO|nr:DUF2911 domain-containing protein [Frigoriflavimonas asaccharolytica]NRS92093.1 hypothetical protein [Frigoriflavimonas asaccharolytica]